MKNFEPVANSLLFAAFPVAMIAGMHDLVGIVSLPTYLFMAMLFAGYFCRACYEVAFRRKRSLAPFLLGAMMLATMAMFWARAGATDAALLFALAYLIWVNIVRGMWTEEPSGPPLRGSGPTRR